MPALRVGVEQRETDESRCFEGGTKPDREVATLDLPHRVVADAGPFGKLLNRPAALKARETDLRAEQARSFDYLGRIRPRLLHISSVLAVKVLYLNFIGVSALSRRDESLESKKTAHGQAEGLRLIQHEFPDVLAATAATRFDEGDAQLMDVLDAYAALESALHVAAGDYEELGGETDRLGLMMRMVF